MIMMGVYLSFALPLFYFNNLRFQGFRLDLFINLPFMKKNMIKPPTGSFTQQLFQHPTLP
jgi:hypothetical protein